MRIEITIEVNGAAHRLEVEPTETLLDLLRERLGLTGTNKDCCMGICGACTVLFNRRPVSSCLLLAGQADGGAVTTVEGLECNGALSPLQEAFLKHGATQCGYCTPGFLMTATALLEETPSPHPCGYHGGVEGQPLPLHGLQEDHRSRGIRRREAARRTRAPKRSCSVARPLRSLNMAC